MSRSAAPGACALLALAFATSGCGGPGRDEEKGVVITRVPPADEGGPFRLDIIEGRATGARPGQRIVLYARSGAWWVQPLDTAPFTDVAPDSRWTNSTHLGTEYAALLVEPGYTPPATTETLPSEGGRVAAVTVVRGSRFWTAPWFRLTLVTVVAVVALGLYRARLRRLTRELAVRYEERLAERTRIAQELHDTLLQGFVSASLELHVALDRLPESSPSRPPMARAVEIVSQVIEEGRHTVNALRAPARDPHDLETALARVGADIAGAGATARIVVSGRARCLRPIVRDEVYRIGREALLRAAHDSGASRVEAELEYTDDGLRVVVTDDGRGIETLDADRDGSQVLARMRDRAEAIGGALQVKSRPGAGTEIALDVPARLGYETPTPRRRALLGRGLGDQAATVEGRTAPAEDQ